MFKVLFLQYVCKNTVIIICVLNLCKNVLIIYQDLEELNCKRSKWELERAGQVIKFFSDESFCIFYWFVYFDRHLCLYLYFWSTNIGGEVCKAVSINSHGNVNNDKNMKLPRESAIAKWIFSNFLQSKNYSIRPYHPEEAIRNHYYG